MTLVRTIIPGLTVFLLLMIGSLDCARKICKVHSKDCWKCNECTDKRYDPTMPDAERWCKAPFCGNFRTLNIGFYRCPTTFYGMCALFNCYGGTFYDFKFQHYGECRPSRAASSLSVQSNSKSNDDLINSWLSVPLK